MDFTLRSSLPRSCIFAAARLLGGSPSQGPIDTPVPGELLAEIQRFEDLWSLALGLVGVHLLLIGWLAFTSGFVPRFIGVLVVIAAAGYLADCLGRLLSTRYTIEVASFHLRWRGLAVGVRCAQLVPVK